MALRTGTISQQTRAQRNHDLNITNIRQEIIKKRSETKKLIYLLSTLNPLTQDQINTTEQKNDRWEKLKSMTKEALGKLQKTGPAFIRPTRSRVRTTHPSGGNAITQQHLKDDCDINIIIKRHAETGNISHLNPKKPLYLDCTGVTDLQGALHLVEEAEDNFATLPAAVRKACQNDPVEFVDMLHSIDGTKILAEAGLEYLAEPDQLPPADAPRGPKPATVPPEPLLPLKEKPPEAPAEPTPQGGK